MKEEDKTPEEELSGDRQSTQYTVQGNDYKDVQKTREKIGWAKWDVRFLTKRKYKEETDEE